MNGITQMLAKRRAGQLSKQLISIAKASAAGDNKTGPLAEQLCLIFLEQQGFVRVASNFHCRHGEIDLIVKKPELLLFVEVRYRRSSAFGSAAASVNAAKQQRLRLSAQYFLSVTPALSNSSTNCRMDVIDVSPWGNSTTEDSELWQVGEHALRWLKNAF